MNVLVTATTFPKSIGDSSPRFVYDLCEALVKRKNIKPVVLVPHTKGAVQSEDMNGVHVYRYKYFLSKYELISGNGIISNIKNNKILVFLIPFLILFQFIRVLQLVKEYEVDVVVANWIVPQGFVAVLAKLFLRKNIKVVVISHGGDIALLLKNSILKKIGSFVLDNVDSLVAVSSFIRQRVGRLSAMHAQAPIISMGVDTKKFAEGIQVPYEKKEFDVIFIGRLESKKGLVYLIESLKLINKDTSITAVIIGDGTERQYLTDLVQNGDLYQKVIFTGSLNHDQILPYIKKSKIFVAPSIDLDDDTEGMPTVLLEAMSGGLPIITTDAGGISDVINHNFNGVIVGQKDIKELAHQIVVLLNSPSLRRTLVTNGIASAAKYSYDNIAKKYERVIMDVLNGK